MENGLHYHLKDLLIYYKPKVILKSFLTGFIFFLLPSTLFITLTINIVLLYVYNLIYFLIGLYFIEVLIAAFTNKITIKTFKNYSDHSKELDYDNIYRIITVIAAAVILIIFSIVYYFI